MQAGVHEEAILLDLISDNPFNSRKIYDEHQVRSLAASITKVGLLSPVEVRQTAGGFELVYGHRRLRAARFLGWESIRANVVSMSDEEVLHISLIENIERKDLSDYEKALAFKQMHEEFGETEEEIGRMVGLSKGHISNYLAMARMFDSDQLAVDPDLKKAMFVVSEHHARYLNRIGDAKTRANMLRMVVSENLSVRDLERMTLRLKSWFCQERASPGCQKSDHDADSSQCGGTSDVTEIRNALLSEFVLPKTRDFEKFSSFHAFDDGFSIYSDFPPFRRIEGVKAVKKERDWFDSVAPHLKSKIRDIRIRFFVDTALATLYVEQSGRVDGRTVENVLRGSVLFAKYERSWKIVHEHWSPLERQSRAVQHGTCAGPSRPPITPSLHEPVSGIVPS